MAIIIFGVVYFRKFDWNVLRLVPPGLVGVLVIVKLISIPTYAYGVNFLLRGAGYNVSLKDTYLVNTAAGSASLVSNLKLGLPLRIILYQRMMHVPISTGTALMVLETGLSLIWMAIFAAFPVPGLWGKYAWGISGLIFGIVLIGFIFTASFQIFEAYIPGRIFRYKTTQVVEFIKNFREAIQTIKIKAIFFAVIMMGIAYVMDSSLLLLTLNALGWTTQLHTAVYLTLISYLAGILSFVPMGLGTRELSLVFLLTQMGAPEDIAVAGSLIVRLARTVVLPVSLSSVYVIGLDRIRNWQLSENKSQQTIKGGKQ